MSVEEIKLVDVQSQYERLSYIRPTDEDDKQKILPARFTIPGATWEVAQQVHALLAENVKKKQFRQVTMESGPDVKAMRQLLVTVFEDLLLPYGSMPDATQRKKLDRKAYSFEHFIVEFLMNGVRQRNPLTGLWKGLSDEGETLEPSPSADVLWQKSFLTYGVDMSQTSAGKPPYFTIYMTDEAKGWPAGNIGFNPYKIRNFRYQSEEGVGGTGAPCRRGVALTRQNVADKLEGTVFVLPLDKNMDANTIRSNRFIMRLPVQLAWHGQILKRFKQSHVRWIEVVDAERRLEERLMGPDDPSI